MAQICAKCECYSCGQQFLTIVACGVHQQMYLSKLHAVFMLKFATKVGCHSQLQIPQRQKSTTKIEICGVSSCVVLPIKIRPWAKISSLSYSFRKKILIIGPLTDWPPPRKSGSAIERYSVSASKATSPLWMPPVM